VPNRPAAHHPPGRPARRQADARRGGARERGYTREWEKARAAFLEHHPLCAECRGRGRLTAAEVVDHVTPHRGDARLFWDADNWQALCAPCHNAKTGRGE
jgi:5-methylcytosine-specific restriction protein A